MEAYDLGPEFLHDRGGPLVERVAPLAGRGRADVDAEFRIVGGKAAAPCGLTAWIRNRRRVAEEVQVDGPVGTLPDDAKLGADILLGFIGRSITT
jgi:hypothetical protein